MLLFLLPSHVWLLIPLQHFQSTSEKDLLLFKHMGIFLSCICAVMTVSVLRCAKINIFLICKENMLSVLSKVNEGRNLKVSSAQTKPIFIALHSFECISRPADFTSQTCCGLELPKRWFPFLETFHWNFLWLPLIFYEFIWFLNRSHFRKQLVGLLLRQFTGALTVWRALILLFEILWLEYQFGEAWTITSSLGSSIFLE